MVVPLFRFGAFTQRFTAPVAADQVSNSQFRSAVPAASEVKIKSQGTEVALLPTVCVQVLKTLPPLAVVAKSGNVPEIRAGKLVWALGTWPAATVKLAWYVYPLGHDCEEEAVPVPLRPTGWGLPAPLSLMEMAAERDPAAVGLKVRLMRQVPFTE